MAEHRRRRGDGTKMPSGLWQVRVIVGGKRRAFYGHKLEEAKRKAEAARHEWQPLRSGTVADFLLNEWLPEQREAVKPQTYRGYEQKLRLHVIPHIGHVQLADLTEGDIAGLHKLGDLGGTTRHHVHVILGTALETAHQRGLIKSNPTRTVRAPRMRHKERTYLTPEQMKSLIEAARDEPLGALVILAATTGMRLGELLGLRWDDVDLDHATVTVRRSAVDGYAGRELDTPKSASAMRTIDIAPLTVVALKAHGPGKGLVFPGRNGPMRAQNVQRNHLDPLCEEAGIPRVTIHELRHIHATHLLAGGEHPDIVQKRLGHRHVSITLSVYAAATPARAEHAATLTQKLYG